MPNSFELYGKGVFTTIAIAGGEPMLWEKHWRRLARDAERVGIDLSIHDESATLAELRSAIAVSRIDTGRARITFADRRPSAIWPGSQPADQETELNIIVGERRPIPTNFRLSLSPYTVNSRSALAGVKSCNYLENLLSLDEAKRRGFDEAVRTNEKGHVTSVAMANLFWLMGDVLYTPSLGTGCLAGTTREYILENLDCREVEAWIDELRAADAIYLTSAGLGVAEVAEFDGRKLRPSDHPVTSILPWAT